MSETGTLTPNTAGGGTENQAQKPQSLKEFWEKYRLGQFFQKYMMVIALIAVTALFAAWSSGKLLLPANITSLLCENAYVFVLAAGMLLCILTGGNIDLSVGSVLCFAASVGCVMMANGANVWLSVLVMLLIGLAIGAFQGFWIAKIRVPAFIATLAGMYAFRGFTNIMLQGYKVAVENETYLRFFGVTKYSYIPDILREWFPGLNDALTTDNAFLTGLIGERFITKFNVTCFAIGVLAALIFILFKVRKVLVQKKLGIKQSVIGQVISMILVAILVIWLCFKLGCSRGFPMLMIWVGLVLGIYAYITNKTAIGRHLYAVGGNEKATALSGVKTRNVFWFAYASIGLMAGLAGVLSAGYESSIGPKVGEGYEMDAIAACFIGGASAYGGTGKISGVIIGALLMGVINKGMNIVGTGPNYMQVVKGIVLLIAVLFDVLSKRQKR